MLAPRPVSTGFLYCCRSMNLAIHSVRLSSGTIVSSTAGCQHPLRAVRGVGNRKCRYAATTNGGMERLELCIRGERRGLLARVERRPADAIGAARHRDLFFSSLPGRPPVPYFVQYPIDPHCCTPPIIWGPPVPPAYNLRRAPQRPGRCICCCYCCCCRRRRSLSSPACQCSSLTESLPTGDAVAIGRPTGAPLDLT
jgi:hypothetical protein